MRKALAVVAILAAACRVVTPSAEAAWAITSDEVTIAAREARKACARVSQTAALVKIDRVTLTNLERIKALCDAAAGLPVARRDWPMAFAPEAAEPLFDPTNLSKALEAADACGRLAEQRARDGKTSLDVQAIHEIARVTRPQGGPAVVDFDAVAAFVEARISCSRELGRIEEGR